MAMELKMSKRRRLDIGVACVALALALPLAGTAAAVGTNSGLDTPTSPVTADAITDPTAGATPASDSSTAAAITDPTADVTSPADAPTAEAATDPLPDVPAPAVAPDAAPAAPVPAAPTDPVNWVTAFPDPALRTAVQDNLFNNYGILPGDALMQDLEQLTILNAANLGITNLEGLQHLTALNFLTITDNGVTSLQPLATLPQLSSVYAQNNQISSVALPATNALVDLNLAGNPACPSVDFIRGGNTQSFSLDSCVFQSGMLFTMGGAYAIDGNRYTYVYADGTGTTSFAFSSLADSRSETLLSLGTVARGVSNSVIQHSTVVPDADIRRDHVRTVSTNGSITHTVTVTNISANTVDSAFYQSVDTDLNGNDAVPLLSDGNGGVIISDDAMTVYLQPVSGIEHVYAGRYGASGEAALDNSIANGEVVSTAGRPLFDVLAQGVDSDVYYATPRVTLAPGKSYTFSYRESLFAAADPDLIWVDYVTTDPTTGQDVVLNSVSSEGTTGEILDLTTLAGMPTGYESDPAANNPTQETFGAQGPLTIVTIRVIQAITPTPTPLPDLTPTTPASPAATPASAAATASPVIGTLPVTGASLGMVLAAAAALTTLGAILIRRRHTA